MRKEEALRKANMFGNADQATNSGGKFADQKTWPSFSHRVIVPGEA